MKHGISTKLLVAMLVAVTLPLGTSAVLLTGAVDSAYVTGINRRVHEALELAPAAYRSLFEALKADFEHSTDGVVGSAEFCALAEAGDAAGMARHLEALVAERDDLVELSLADADGDEIAGARVGAGADGEEGGGSSRPWLEEREVAWGEGTAVLTARWVAPGAHFESFQRAGQMLELFGTFERGRYELRTIYLEVYLGMIGFVLIVALGLGFSMSRRVTSRVIRLCEATRQVAGGDLTTRVPEGPRDEVGELAATFNVMVERLLSSRERIEYLGRVAAWQQLARRLAHEIKNPLTPIQLAVQELRDRYKGDDAQFRQVLNQVTEIVVEEVEALRRLTTEFSAFAKLPQVDATPVDLRLFLDEASQPLSLLRSPLGDVEVELPAQGIVVAIDRMLMRRALDNLVRNAVEAIDASGERGRVVVRAGLEGGQPFIAIEDDGPGIEGDDRQRVFEPYYTTKETGTGLGLAIVKKIVLEHGGSVTLEPAERGSRFMIRLPS
jgi:nitrogen fixation/metabolism regulation signal transduction histidine kinase